MAMNPEVKKLWVEALRSGRYEQTTARLKNGESFCCLGVLCDLHSIIKKDGFWKNGDYICDGDESGAALPDPVNRWAGLNDRSPSVFDREVDLSAINDGGMDFDWIAAIIETEL